ncbi:MULTISPECIES: hypothetical protein [unclassified Dysgonomonas]|nr:MULTISPECIES: hypothetical protein [unclassified Dysgonomonas]
MTKLQPNTEYDFVETFNLSLLKRSKTETIITKRIYGKEILHQQA